MELQVLPWTGALPQGDACEHGSCPVPLAREGRGCS